MKEQSATEQIDSIISNQTGWKADVLKQLREAIRGTDSAIIEEIKWRMKTRPEGLAVWSHNGIICFAEIWNDNIKLLFPKGAHLEDPAKLFNARLQSKDIRAIEFKEGSAVNATDLISLVREAVKINT